MKKTLVPFGVCLTVGLTTLAIADIDYVDLGMKSFSGPGGIKYKSIAFAQEKGSPFILFIDEGGDQVAIRDFPPVWTPAESFIDGEVIGPELEWSWLGAVAGFGDSDCVAQHFDWSIVDQPKFAAIRFDLGRGNYQYAWLRISSRCDGKLSLANCVLGQTCHFGNPVALDIGIEQEPNKPIIAGDKGCPAEMDGEPGLSIDDFIAFQTHFAFQSPLADCDLDALHSIDDFICFQTLFALGC